MTSADNSDLRPTIELGYTIGLNEKKRQVNIKAVNVRPRLQQNTILTNIQRQWCSHFLHTIWLYINKNNHNDNNDNEWYNQILLRRRKCFFLCVANVYIFMQLSQILALGSLQKLITWCK